MAFTNPTVGDVATYNFTGSNENVDVSNVEKVEVRMWGAGGGSPELGNGVGGNGGYLEFTYNVSELNTITVSVGETGGGGSYASGGWGIYNGGDVTGNVSYASAGGGSTMVLNGSGTEIAAADAGGGADTYYNDYGGGGARGGTAPRGGDGDAEGTGFGGDACARNSGDDGGHGGQELIDTTNTSLITATDAGGSGSGQNGQIEVEVTALPTAKANVYDGSTFVERQVYRYDGSSWVKPAPIKIYDGTTWVEQ